MTCPVCNTQNSAMTVRCMQCHTLLIHSAEERAPQVKAFVSSMDTRMYSGIGSLACFVLAGLIFQNAGVAIFSGIVGGMLGRIVAKLKAKNGE